MYLLNYQFFLRSTSILAGIVIGVLLFHRGTTPFSLAFVIGSLLVVQLIQFLYAKDAVRTVVFCHFIAASVLSFIPYLLSFAPSFVPTITLYLYSFLTLLLLLVTDFNNIFTKH
jgi:ABC-type Mn2+/Zn2+ transport system permease subunit